MVIRLLRTYLCIFSAVLARLCKFYGVANRCIYSAECDGCACRECHIHCPTRWCESCHWQWYLLERIEFGRALSERSWFSPRLKKSLDYNVRPAPPARVSRRYLPQPARVFKVPPTPRPDCSIFVKLKTGCRTTSLNDDPKGPEEEPKGPAHCKWGPEGAREGLDHYTLGPERTREGPGHCKSNPCQSKLLWNFVSHICNL